MANTPNRNWPIPALSGTLKGNGELLIAILGLIDGDMQAAINAASGKAGLVSPAFSGIPSAPTPVSGDDSNKLATTAFVNAALALAIANLKGGASAALDTLKEIEDKFASEDTALAAMLSTLATKAASSYVDSGLALKQDIASRGSLSGLRNKLLNTSGEIIQRFAPTGTTIAAGASAYVLDRWLVTNNTNQPVSVSQYAWGLGGGFVANMRHAMQYAFATAPTTGTLRIEQRAEFVTSIKPGLQTLTAWMTGPAGSEAVTAEIVQNFGTGGSPSAPVTTPMTVAGSSPTTVYNASTNRRCWGVTVPSLTGKLLGTGGNDYLAVAMVLTPRQSGSYYLGWCSFVEGDASNETDPQSPVDFGQMLRRCQRFFQARSHVIDAYGTYAYSPYQSVTHFSPMRASPSVTFSTSTTAGSFSGPTIVGDRNAFVAYLSSTGGGSNTWGGTINFNAEL